MPTLRVNDFRIEAHIGCGEEERSTPQTLSFNVEIVFFEIPLTCKSDKIEDTLCYQGICENIVATVKKSPVATIEYLTSEILKNLKSLLPKKSTLKVSTQKVSPPIAGLYGGATFQMELST